MKKRYVFEVILVLVAALILTLSNISLGAKIESFLDESFDVHVVSQP